MSSDLNEQLATLAREQGLLEALLEADVSWRALQQLEAREVRGEPLSSVDGADLRACLLTDLAGNRLYQARNKILEAIGILTESAALPSPEMLAPVVSAQPKAAATAHTIEAPIAVPAEAAPVVRAIVRATPPTAALAAPTRSPVSSALTFIRGIDATLAARLAELGVTRFSDIALWSTEDVQRVSAKLGLGRNVSRQNWIEQAAILALKAGQSIAPPAKAARVAPVAPAIPTETVLAATATTAPTVSNIISDVAQSIAARLSAASPEGSQAAVQPNTEVSTIAETETALPQSEPSEVEVAEATVDIVARNSPEAFEKRIAGVLADNPAEAPAPNGKYNGPGALNGSKPGSAVDADVLLGNDWAPLDDKPTPEASRLPDILEQRLATLESDVAAATADVSPPAALGPVLPPAPLPPASIAKAPELPDVGATLADMLPPVPTRHSPEAEVQVVRRSTPGDAHSAVQTSTPRAADFDASQYAAYREQAEEASVEIVRDGDRPQRTRLPGKPTRATRDEQASAVRRFLAALNGK